jgi:hypothetical protein
MLNIYLFLILVTLLFIFFYPRTNIKFYRLEYLLNEIKNNKYLDTLSYWNLKVRNSISTKHYFSKIKLYTRTPNYNEKILLYRACKHADRILRKNNFPDIAVLYWKIYVFKNIEGNMPHTQGSFILLPESSVKNSNIRGLISTLIHEKVHIYQKLYPNENRKIAKKYDYNIINIKDKVPKYVLEQVRSNPDINNDYYIWKKRYVPLYLFNSDSLTLNDASLKLYDIDNDILIEPNEVGYYDYLRKKTRMKDLKKEYIFEHPNELSAYFIENKCSFDVKRIADFD